MKNKFYYIGMNFFVPGMGQIAAKRFFRGTIQAITAIGAVIWLAAVVVLPFMKFYSGDMLAKELPKVNFVGMIMPIVLFIVILVWSIVDLMFGFDKNNCEKIEENS